MMTLNELFNTNQYPDLVLSEIMDDSREMIENSIFFSLQGLTHDGHQFINQAITNGAKVIVHSRELKNKKEGVIYIYDPKLNQNYADYVNRFYEYPSKKLNLIGVTGTNGKSSIVFLIRYLLNHFKKAASLGTMGVIYDDVAMKSSLTTSTLVNTQRILKDLVNKNISVCAMEASSQGIDMGRIDKLEFDCAIFTNLTQDHLDYHLNMESYYQAKKKLFTQLELTQKAIINIDDPYGKRLAMELVSPSITVSMLDEKADYFIRDIKLSLKGSQFTLVNDKKEYHFTTNLLGKFNIMNLVQALAACVHQGIELQYLVDLVLEIPEIEGRLDMIDSGLGFKVIIDFAHSPDSMEKVLEFAKRSMTEAGRVIAVFGSAGKRDKSKRPIMGSVADKFADLIYLTQDDPRDEKVEDICDEIATGIFNHPYVIISSRAMAIHLAIQSANKNDIIVLMGKGQDDFMAVGNKNIPYETDYNLTQEAIEQLRKDKFEDYESIY